MVSATNRELLESLSQGHEEVIDQIHTYESSLLAGSLGPPACVWSSFLQMVQDWRLHLQLTEQMLPSKFAYDHPNYVRFLTYYTVSNILHSCSAEIARNASTDSSAVQSGAFSGVGHFQEGDSMEDSTKFTSG